jgi:Rieske Fe-S protein
MDHHDERADEQREGATEQVGDYLRLEEHIAQLQTNRRPRRPPRLPPDQVRIYQTAALFRAAAPGAAEPDLAFAAQLRARLEREAGQGRGANAGAGRPRGMSRRNLLAGGLTAAAAAAAGVAAGVAIDRAEQPAPSSNWAVGLVPEPNGVWTTLFPAAELPVGGVRRFASDEVVGFVRHTAAGFEALSGACTHMGCLVTWNSAARTFDCPCHGGRFLEDGWAAPSSSVAYRPLPTIGARVQDGQVQVYLPPSSTSASTTTPDSVVEPYR